MEWCSDQCFDGDREENTGELRALFLERSSTELELRCAGSVEVVRESYGMVQYIYIYLEVTTVFWVRHPLRNNFIIFLLFMYYAADCDHYDFLLLLNILMNICSK